MNKYIIPICDIPNNSIWNELIYARSISECQDKLMVILSEKLGIDEVVDFDEFVRNADTEHDVMIGDITDIEAL